MNTDSIHSSLHGQPDVEDWSHKGLQMNNGVKSLFLHSMTMFIESKNNKRLPEKQTMDVEE